MEGREAEAETGAKPEAFISSRGRQTRYRWRGQNSVSRGAGAGRQGASLVANEVPESSVVLPGAGVSVVLKMDQSTGRQVQGIVQSVLGRGNHPRGIKVRLVDGRVGRVQAMVDQHVARQASTGLPGLGSNGEASNDMNPISRHVTKRPDHGDDMQSDGYVPAGAQVSPGGSSLMDYVRPARKAARKSATNSSSLHDETTKRDQTIVCPVCHEFEGDYTAVAFHISSHFE